MTLEERQASIEATATERAATLNPVVHPTTVADLHKRVSELEGKPFQGDSANDFHLKGDALEDQHGKARAKFILKLTQGALIEESFIPLFLKYLNEYEVDDSGDPPYDVAGLAEQGEVLNHPLGSSERLLTSSPRGGAYPTFGEDSERISHERYLKMKAEGTLPGQELPNGQAPAVA
jgi:hypothetical protein